MKDSIGVTSQCELPSSADKADKRPMFIELSLKTLRVQHNRHGSEGLCQPAQSASDLLL